MNISIISLFPEYFEGPLNTSILKRAQQKGLIHIEHVDLRQFGEGKHKRVDDRPYGGGPGMVLMAEPLCKAVRSVKGEDTHTIYLTPQGKPLHAKKCQELAQYRHLVLLCGHYEGVDERAIELEADEEISIGDVVLTNGELAALVLIDAMVRFIPGVLGHPEAAEKDSFQGGLLDYPHYTRPELFEGVRVPEVLLGGNHQLIDVWREQKAREKTERIRPELILEG